MRKKIVIGLVVVVAGGIGLAFAMGWLNWDRIRSRATDRNTWTDIRTRAQVEEAKLKAKVSQLTAETTVDKTQAAQVCRQNLRRIESAKRAVASRTGIATGTVSWDAVVKEMGGQVLKCPQGGEYTLGPLEQLPRCSIGANGTPDKGDDHLIAFY